MATGRRLGQLLRGELGLRAAARKILAHLLAAVAPAHRTNASGNNASQR